MNDTTDALSREGAIATALRLDAFWQEQGATTARHWVEPRGAPGSRCRGAVWVVRSNLVRGLPPPSLAPVTMGKGAFRPEPKAPA